MEECKTPKIKQDTRKTSSALLPKSVKYYEIAYKNFMDWHSENDDDSFSESVLVAYFEEQAKKYKWSTLWTRFSMLKHTLEMHHKVKLDHYEKLKELLRSKSDGYTPKKAKTFTTADMDNFMQNADDNKYLATKVTLIMSCLGSCRSNELQEMNIEDVEDLKTAMLVSVKSTRNYVRKFKITGEFYNIVKKYVALRPQNGSCNAFFLSYQNGRCTSHRTGINNLSTLLGKQIATFLKLPNPESYNGYSFRRASISNFHRSEKNLRVEINAPTVTISNCSNFTINLRIVKQTDLNQDENVHLLNLP